MLRHVLALLNLVVLCAVAMTAPARADDTLNLSIPQKGGWEPSMAALGVEQGIFRRAGLNLNISWTSGGADTVSAVANGNAEFGLAVGTTASIAAYAKGAPIRIVGASMTGVPDIYLYVRPDSPIKSMADANGKTVAFTRPGSSSFAITHVLAQQYNVQPTFVSAGDFSSTLTQVMSGQIDIGWGSPPFGNDLLLENKIRIIALGSDAKALQNQTVRVMIGNANFIKNHRDVAERFWRAYDATIDWVYANPQASLAAFARFNNMPVALVKDMMKTYPRKSMNLSSVSDFNRSVEEAVTFKFIDKPLDAAQSQGIFDILAPRR